MFNCSHSSCEIGLKVCSFERGITFHTSTFLKKSRLTPFASYQKSLGYTLNHSLLEFRNFCKIAPDSCTLKAEIKQSTKSTIVSMIFGTQHFAFVFLGSGTKRLNSKKFESDADTLYFIRGRSVLSSLLMKIQFERYSRSDVLVKFPPIHRGSSQVNQTPIHRGSSQVNQTPIHRGSSQVNQKLRDSQFGLKRPESGIAFL